MLQQDYVGRTPVSSAAFPGGQETAREMYGGSRQCERHRGPTRGL